MKYKENITLLHIIGYLQCSQICDRPVSAIMNTKANEVCKIATVHLGSIYILLECTSVAIVTKGCLNVKLRLLL
jgi:hypothetical protein